MVVARDIQNEVYVKVVCRLLWMQTKTIEQVVRRKFRKHTEVGCDSKKHTNK